jgi:hypothetical protein
MRRDSAANTHQLREFWNNQQQKTGERLCQEDKLFLENNFSLFSLHYSLFIIQSF